MIDNVIMSSNEDPTYLDYWPMVAGAWKALGFDPWLALISADEELGTVQREHGRVWQLDPVEGMPDGHLAKVSRLMLAAHLDGESLLSDVDMMPLAGMRDYLDMPARRRKPGQLVVYGADAYKDWAKDRYPICYLLAERQTWRQIVNPEGPSVADLLERWRGPKGLDHRDDPWGEVFSDESLLQWLLRKWNKPKRVVEVNRGMMDWSKEFTDAAGITPIGIPKGRINRGVWTFDTDELDAGLYIDAHLPRPARAEHRIDILIKSLEGSRR